MQVKVKCLGTKADYTKDDPRDYLEIGKVYEVKSSGFMDSWIAFELVEFPGKYFHEKLFEEFPKKPEPKLEHKATESAWEGYEDF